jgi:hypothetical protein
VYAATAHPGAQHEHGVAEPVVGAAVAVLAHRATELAHRHHGDLVAERAEVGEEGGER